MALKGTGRTPLNLNVHRDQILKENNLYFEWKKRWSWLAAEYAILQKQLAQTSVDVVKKEDKRTILPVPQQVNHEYGWIGSKEEFRLNKWGPDLYIYPMEAPDDDD